MNFKDFKEKVSELPFFDTETAIFFGGSDPQMRVQLSRWTSQGLILQLKRGFYMLSESERTLTPSREAIAAYLIQPSYISLESALSHHHLIPERVEAITSVTPKKTRTIVTPLGAFIYRTMKVPLQFGFFKERDEQGLPYFIADPEKALLDYLYLNLGQLDPAKKNALSDFLRIQNTEQLNLKKLHRYSARFAIKKLSQIVEELL